MLNFALLNMVPTLVAGGYTIVATTSTPCHLYMYWTLTEPEKHATPILKRGLLWKDAIRFCFVNWHQNEQEEEGDTLEHTFHKCGWLHCEKRWFTFRATINGDWSPSSTPIFSRHRVVPPEGVLGEYFDYGYVNPAGVTNDSQLGQSFTPKCNYNILSLSVPWQGRPAGCDGILHVQLRTNDDNHPSDTILFEGLLDCESFPPDSQSWYTFPIESLPVLAGMPYWIVQFRTGYTWWFLYPLTNINSGNLYLRGEMLLRNSPTGSWYGYGEGQDYYFRIRGD